MFKDKSGQPIDDIRFLELVCDPDYPTVGLDEIGGYRITTLWFGNGFETMVFTPADAVKDLTRRYDTLAQAEAGHLHAVRAVEQMEAAK